MWGALTLLVWLALGWAWWFASTGATIRSPLGEISELPRFGSLARKGLYLRAHCNWLNVCEWILRWIVVPANDSFAMAPRSGDGGCQWRRILQDDVELAWWSAVVVAALVAVRTARAISSIGLPHGTVTHQIWAVSVKAGGSVFAGRCELDPTLAWAAVLLASRRAQSRTRRRTSLVRRRWAPAASEKTPFVYRSRERRRLRWNAERSQPRTCARP